MSAPQTAIDATPLSRSAADREKRWPELDGLRGAAILMVFLLHYVTDSRTHVGVFGPLYRFAQLFRMGWSGVDLFFVLSGFLIGGILLDARSSRKYFQTFYTRRVCRILPVYYLWLALYGLLGFAILEWDLIRNPEIIRRPLGVGSYFLFLQNIVGMPDFAYAKYLASPTWSLAVEEQFYLIAPLLIRFLSLRTLTRVLVGCVAGAPVLRYLVFSYFPDGASKANILMPCRADALAIGMLAAIAWRTPARHWLGKQVPWLKALCGVLALGFAGMVKWLPGPRTALEAALQYSWLALLFGSALLVLLLDPQSTLARIARWGFLRHWARISYCFYLLHFGTLGICHWLFFRSLPRIDDLPGAGVTLLAGLLTWGLTQASWKYLEKPLIDRGHSVRFE